MARKKSQGQAADLRAMNEENLSKELEEAYRRLFTVRLQLSTRQQTNTSEPAKVRKQIARIRTIQRERELAAAFGETGGRGK
jgi:large subunit ribosomal protein L29